MLIFVTNVVIMGGYSSNKNIKNLVNEPDVFYNLNNKYDRIISILGGSASIGQAINSDIDLIEISRKGLPKSVVVTLSKILGISMEEMSHLIHVSHRTIQRKNDTDLLNVYSTEQILEIAEVISRGVDVFGTVESFTSWLHDEIRHLNYKKPIHFLDTSFGTKLILDTLGRIEHGIYS